MTDSTHADDDRRMLIRRLVSALGVVLALSTPAAVNGAAAATSPLPTVAIDPGHDQLPNPATEPIGPGSAQRKIKDGGGALGVVSGTPEAVVTLAVSLRLRALLRRAGVRVGDDTGAHDRREPGQHRSRPRRRSCRRRALRPHPRRRLDPTLPLGTSTLVRRSGAAGPTTSVARGAARRTWPSPSSSARFARATAACSAPLGRQPGDCSMR